jgi:predicted lipoprotein with Yx(FWY)xxD motif
MTIRARLLKLALVGMIPGLIVSLSLLAVSTLPASAGMQMSYTVNVMTASDGSMYLADQMGMPLYTYTKDTPNAGTSAVSGNLLNAWPALTVQAGQQPTLDPMAMGTLGTITRSDNGAIQVTYNGWPLYTFVRDQAMAAPTGNGVAGFALATP